MTITLTTHGATVVLDLPNDDHITKVITKNQDWYEKAMLEDIYARKLQGTAIDVGACFGTHALYFAAVCGLQVLAIEPRPDNYSVLTNNIRINNLGNQITPMPMAVGAAPGFVTLEQMLADNRGSTTATSAQTGIPVLTIDSLSPQDISLIKIDVEGMELQVLRGAKNTLLRQRPMVYVEAPNTHKGVTMLLRSLHYQEIGKWNATPTYGFAPRR